MKIVYLMFLSFFIAGCGTSVTKVVKESDTEYLSIPYELLEECPISTPPSKKDYMQSNMQERENLLVNYSVELNKDLQFCNLTKKQIRDYQNNVREIVKNKKKSE